jgi:hypothetical protein
MVNLALVIGGAAVLVIAIVLPIVLRRRPGRPSPARAVTWIGFGILAGFSLIAGLFIAGEIFAEPGGVAALWLVLAWLIPLLVLVALALFAVRWGAWVLAGLSAVMVTANVWFVVDPVRWGTWEDQVGPVRTIAVFVLAAALGVLGLKRTAIAGWLLLVVGLAPVIIAGFGDLAGVASLSVVSGPAVVTGVLYLVSAQLARGSKTTSRLLVHPT